MQAQSAKCVVVGDGAVGSHPIPTPSFPSLAAKMNRSVVAFVLFVFRSFLLD
jgi:hypothetical protein